MNANPSAPDHRRSQRAIDAHFAGRSTPAAEQAMRAHLPTCAACTHRYERQLIFARLDSRALPAEDRIAAGLGFAAVARRPARRWLMFLGPAMVAAVVALVLFGRPSGSDEGTERAFTARGAAVTAERFWTYQVRAGAPPVLLDRTLGRDDEVAFAYSNPAGKPFLMIFGVDDHHHVYWFHPGWPENAPPPTSVPATGGPGPYELAGAIRHRIDGTRLKVYALFSEQPLLATAVEAQIAAAPDGDALPGEGRLSVMRAFEVRP